MTISKYLDKYMKSKDIRALSKLNHDGIEKIIKNTDEFVWNSMEDLFGNLFTNFNSLIHYIENKDLSEEQKNTVNEELAKSISILATIRDYFTAAKLNKD